MADKKISALPASTTPLAGTEVLPIVQSGATVKVAVSDLTAGRAISATQLTLTTGNLIVASGQGIDFSATPGTGTSELFNDYEEGTWTPTITFGSGNVGTTYSSQVGRYTRIGNRLFFDARVTFSAKGSSTGSAQLVGVPFGINGSSNSGFYIDYYGNMLALGSIPFARVNSAASGFNISSGGATGSTDLTDVNFTNTTDFRCAGFYDI
jgi:hypothetical protein